jgi:hypothetical protein
MKYALQQHAMQVADNGLVMNQEARERSIAPSSVPRGRKLPQSTDTRCGRGQIALCDM